MKEHQEIKKLMTQQPRQEIKNVQETSVTNAVISTPERLAPSKPMLRMVEAVSQDVIAKLQKAVNENDRSVFNQIINNVVSSASTDQLAVTLSSLKNQKATLNKSSDRKQEPGLGDKIKMLTEGIESLSKASEKPRIGKDEVVSAPQMTRKM